MNKLKKKPVDYSGFSLRRLNEPRFSHVKLLGGWIFYFVMYFITENLIPREACHVIHCALDDMIPFNEFFLIFYVGWYAFVFGALAYTFFYDVENFRKLQIFIIQDMRPEVFERENVLTALMAFIYSFDTSTGVCPSLHVGYSLGIVSVALKDRSLPLGWKIGIGVFAFMVCLAVCFVKQHSALDVFWALPMCLVAEIITYGKDYWLPRLKSGRVSKQTV